MRLAAIFALAVLAAGCGGGAAKQGGERQDCYPNGTCNAGLTCASNVCVNINDGGAGTQGGGGSQAGSAGGAGGGIGGGGGSTGAAGSAGSIGGAGASGTGGTGGSTAGTGGGSSGASGTAGAGGTPTCFTAASYGDLGSKIVPSAELGNALITWDLPLEAATPGDALDIQLFSTLGVFQSSGFVTGTFQIAGEELNYATCGLCVLIYENLDANGNYRGAYLATSGTVTLTSVATKLTGTLSNIKLQHVTIDQISFQSTPHADGCRSAVDSLSFNVDIVPAP